MIIDLRFLSFYTFLLYSVFGLAQSTPVTLKDKSDYIFLDTSEHIDLDNLQLRTNLIASESKPEYMRELPQRSPRYTTSLLTTDMRVSNLKIASHNEDGSLRIVHLEMPLGISFSRSSVDLDELLLSRAANFLSIERDENRGFVIAKKMSDAHRIHYFYDQTYRGIPIYGGSLHIHADSEKQSIYSLKSTVQDVSGVKNLATSPTIDSLQALRALYDKNNWKRGFFPSYILPKDSVALVFYPTEESGKFLLAYEVLAHPDPSHRVQAYVDAHTGVVIDQFETVCKMNHQLVDGPKQALARDLAGQTRSINTYELQGTHILLDASRPMFRASESSIPSNPVGGIMTLDAGNQPIDENTSLSYGQSVDNRWVGQEMLVSGHYNAGVAYEYFRTTFGRNSLDGAGGSVISVVNVADEDGGNLENAFWNGAAMFYGNGGRDFRPLVLGLDVAGHEMSHGVIQHTANLEYLGESGAINESYADIFGAMIDRDDWLIGEDVVLRSSFPSGALRNMMNPNNGGTRLGQPGYQPSTYQTRFTGTEDNGGVHINSGIGNRAYYLFATTVGKDVAEQVFYHALVNYLGRRSTFYDWREAVIMSSNDRYGQSVAVEAGRAFDQVGITAQSNPGNSDDGGFADLTPNPGDGYILYTSTQDSKMNLLDDQLNEILAGIINETAISKPSISDNGSLIVFINQSRHAAFTTINWQTGTVAPVEEINITSNGQLIEWNNCAISKDGRLLALIPASQDNPSIVVFDLSTGNPRSFPLYNPTTGQGNNTGEVRGADALEFDHAGEFLVYDALNRTRSGIGSTQEYWSINLINIWDKTKRSFAEGVIIPLYGSLPNGVSIGNPTFSKNSTGVLAFDYIETGNTGEMVYEILATDLASGSSTFSLFENSRLGYPSYSSDDSRILFNATSQNQDVVAWLPLAPSKVEPQGNPQGIVLGTWGVWFSNGQRQLTSLASIERVDVGLSVFPNPFEHEITIQWELNKAEFSAVQIYDSRGLLIHTRSISRDQSRLTLQGANWASGVYQVVLVGENVYAATKVVKN